jgi:hypothetical protein
MRNLLLNIQHLLNSFRPYQAREELISELQGQLDDKRGLIELLRSQCDKCNVNIGELGGIGIDVSKLPAGAQSGSSDASTPQARAHSGEHNAQGAKRLRG